MRLFSSAFLLVFLSMWSVGCADSTSQTTTKKLSEKSSPQFAASLSTEELVEKFKIFDPNYNYLHTSTSSLSYVQEHYPVLDGQDSSLSIVKQDEMFGLRMKLLDGAKKSVRIQSLVFSADESGWQIADKLVELKKRGISVKLIIDSASNMKLNTQRMYFHLEENGISVEGYEPLYLWPIMYSPVGVSFSDRAKLVNMRYHEKVFAVDSELPESATTIMGGSNLSNEYFRVEKKDAFKMYTDLDVVLRGEAAIRAAAFFDENLAIMQTERKAKGRFTAAAFWETIATVAQKLKKDELFSVHRPEMDAAMVKDLNLKKLAPTEFTWHSPTKWRLLQSRPRLDQFYIEDAYIDLVRSATKSIEIANAYFIPSSELVTELKAAVKRGVNIRIVTNSPTSTEFLTMCTASRSLYKVLLEANTGLDVGSIQIFEWQGDKILNNGEGHFHAKFAVFDDEASIIGSYNLDPRSRLSNSENVLVALDGQLAVELSEQFTRHVRSGFSREILLPEATRFSEPSKSFMERLRQGLVPFVEPYL